MKVERLQPADVVAVLAALVLLFVMAMDWYSTTVGQEARRIEELADPQGAEGGVIERRIDEDARFTAEDAERNAWQENGGVDLAILVALLATVLLAFTSAALRAAGRQVEPPLTPSSAGSLVAALAALLVTYRIWQEPGADDFNTVQSGAPIAVIVLGVLSLALATAYRGEERAARREDREAGAAKTA